MNKQAKNMRIVGWVFLVLAGYSYYKGLPETMTMVVIGMSNVWFAASAVCRALIASMEYKG